MKRILGLDLIRFFAVFFVPAVHFFLNNNFYNTNINGHGYLISIFILFIFYIGVPLFLLLTGYLKRKKELNKNHYKDIIRILVSYFFISVICTLVRKYILLDDIRLLSTLINVFNFKACGYSWYIEMYIGLFLFIPFLNILYNNLESKKHKQLLIIILLLSCSFCPVINFIKIDGVYLNVIPDWWTGIYPFIYYFIGCYIGEYKIKVNKTKLFLFGFCLCIFVAFAVYNYNLNKYFSWSFFWSYNSIFTIVLSVIFFLLLYDVDINNKIINKFITSVSKLSLDIYLFSYLVDRFTYQYLNNYLHTPIEYLKYIIPIILFVFIVSYLLSYIKNLLFTLVKKIFPKLQSYI